MHFQPVNQYVVVEKLAKDTTHSSGLILTVSTDECDRCKVVAVPSTTVEDEAKLPVQRGDVLLIRWSQALKISDQYYAVDLKDIVTKIF